MPSHSTVLCIKGIDDVYKNLQISTPIMYKMKQESKRAAASKIDTIEGDPNPLHISLCLLVLI